MSKNARVGEMGQSGAEVACNFSCYVGLDGKAVKSREQTPSAGS